MKKPSADVRGGSRRVLRLLGVALVFGSLPSAAGKEKITDD
jgi:hypothetical protein